MKLFYTKRSPYARKVRIVTLEKSLTVELVEVDLANKPAELLKANPLGKIPVLELDDGQTLCDSSLICDYLDRQYSSPGLVPEQSAQREAVLNLDALAKGVMDVAITVFYEKLRHPDNSDQAFVEKQEQTILRAFCYFNGKIDDLAAFSLASISVASAIGYVQFRLGHLWPPRDCQALKEWFDAISRRHSFKVTVPAA